MEESCLFCLEDGTKENKVICLNFSKEKENPCNCRIYSHVHCWMTYYIKKGNFECPICHSKFKSKEETREQVITINNTNNIYTVILPTNVQEQDNLTNLSQSNTINRNLILMFIILSIFIISAPFIIIYNK
jgi:hypothetical protein